MADMEKVRELVEGGWEHDKPVTSSHVLYVLGVGSNHLGHQFLVVWDPIKKTVRHIDKWTRA